MKTAPASGPEGGLEVRVRLYGSLQQFRPKDAPRTGAFPIRAAADATVAEVADQLGLPSAWLGPTLVNEERCGKDRVLRAGDLVTFFSPVRGGTDD